MGAGVLAQWVVTFIIASPMLTFLYQYFYWLFYQESLVLNNSKLRIENKRQKVDRFVLIIPFQSLRAIKSLRNHKHYPLLTTIIVWILAIGYFCSENLI